MSDINIAVVGAGYWGQKVIREYQALAQHDPNLNFTSCGEKKVSNIWLVRVDNLKGVHDLPEYMNSLSSSSLEHGGNRICGFNKVAC